MFERNSGESTIVIGCSMPPGKGKGISTYSQLLAEGFASKGGYKIAYVCPVSEDVSWFEKYNIEPIFFDPCKCGASQLKEILLGIGKLDDVQAIINNDVIHLQSLAPVFRSVFISVVHLSSYSIGQAALVNKGYVDFYIAISNDMLTDLIRRGVSPERIVMVTNGVQETKQVSKDFKEINIVAGVEFTRRKGGDLLVSLLKLLKKSDIDFTFSWFGLSSVEHFAEFNYDARFNFYQKLPREEYIQKMSKGNVYLFPSREEGCPMSLKEAMQSGLVPIAANGTGAMGQIIRHGLDGFLLPVRDWAENAFKLIDFYAENSHELDGISRESMRRIESGFTMQSVIGSIEELILRRSKRDLPDIDISNLKVYSWHRLPVPYIKKSFLDYYPLIKFRLGMIGKPQVIAIEDLTDVGQ